MTSTATTESPQHPRVGRLFAIGDIHGCDVALNALLALIELASEDALVVLGDIVDRGPGTRQAMERLLAVQSECRLIVLQGNHEEMLLDAWEYPEFVESWLQVGGKECLDSYGGSLEQIPPSHVEFLRASRDWHESPEAIFVHANLEPGAPLDEQTPERLRWTKLTYREPPHPSGKPVICGHTPQLNGLPWIGNGWLCFDTAAYRGLYLTAYDATNGLVYQSRQNGAVRGPVPLRECYERWSGQPGA